tara:strand:- start:153 stop:563 length:411 start_codon:yes stop_codon:yes gene_type:complete
MVEHGTPSIFLVAVIFAVSTTTGYSQYQLKAGLGGRPVRGNSGLKWVSIQSIRKQQTILNQVVNGVVGTKPNSAGKRVEITAIQKRLSARMPLSIVRPNTRQSGQFPKRPVWYGLKVPFWQYTIWYHRKLSTPLGK